MKNRRIAILSFFLLSVTLGCSNNILNTSKNKDVKSYSFNSKVLPDPNATPSIYSYDYGVQYAGATYKGNWFNNYGLNITSYTDFEDNSKGFASKTRINDFTIANFPSTYPNTNISYNNSWGQGNYTGYVGISPFVNSGLPYDLVQNKLSEPQNSPLYNNIKYANGKDPWQIRSFGPSVFNTIDTNTGEPLVIDCNSNIVTYNGTGWKNKVKNGTTIYKYNYDDKSHADPSKRTSIEFNFTGTNIELFGIKGLDPGWNNIKITITDSTGNEIPETINQKNIDMGSNIVNENASIIKLNGLKHDTYHVKIESADGSRYPDFRKPTFLYGFTKAVIYPSVEYNVTDYSFTYKAFIEQNLGKADIYIDGIKKYTADLNSTNFSNFDYAYAYSFGTKGQHRVTIEAIPSTSSSSHSINIDAFGALPYAEGSFTGDEFNLMYYKTFYSSAMDFYIDGIKKTDINTLFNSQGDLPSFLNINSLGNTNHTFSIISQYYKKFEPNSPSVNGYTMILDAYSGEYRAGFKFVSNTLNNSGIKYKTIGGIDKGIVKVSIDNDPNFTQLVDLYRPNTSGIVSTPIEVSFMNIPLGEHMLIVEPSYTKNPSSTGLDVSIDNIEIIGGDSICEPTSLPIPTPS
ncbi:MAG: hypothetical protein U0457_15700 [Candidatus Sericytochromatia bacterium]